MPNPHAWSFCVVALSAALSLLIVSLSTERFARAWRTVWPLDPSSAAAPATREAPPPAASTLAADFGGICAARATEALTEGVADALRIRCPAHGTAPGAPCLAESDPPADGAWTTVTSQAAAEEAPPPEGPPPIPIKLQQERAYSSAPDAKRCQIVGHDPARQDCWLVRVVPHPDTDPETIAATEESRRRWQTTEDVEMFWPHVVTAPQAVEPEPEPTIEIEPAPESGRVSGEVVS